jgi:hypothetical protein
MRAILIDAANQVVREIDLQPDSEENLPQIICREIGCTAADLIRLDDHDLWVNQDWLNATPYGFSMSGVDSQHTYFGNGLILSRSEDRHCSATWLAESVASVVDFWSSVCTTGRVH